MIKACARLIITTVAAMAKKADGIWSDDKDFLVQSKIKIYKTKELV